MAVTSRLAVVAVALAAATARADDGPPAGYELRLSPGSVDAQVGDAGAVSLTIAPRPGYSIDRDGPLRIALVIEPAEGVELEARRYRRRDAADARADAPRFDLGYRAVAAGDYQLRIEARFWVCRRYTCRAAVERRAVPVRVREPAPPPSEPPADAAPPQ